MVRVALIVAMSAGAAVAACAPARTPPSLQPRAAEAIDPRVPVERPMNDRPVRAELAQQLDALVAQAKAGDAAFQPLIERSEQLASAAGPPQSESWIVAQQALSAAVGGRAATARAIGDIDALGATLLQTQGGLAPADLAAIEAAARQVAALDERQASRVSAVQRRLGL